VEATASGRAVSSRAGRVFAGPQSQLLVPGSGQAHFYAKSCAGYLRRLQRLLSSGETVTGVHWARMKRFLWVLGALPLACAPLIGLGDAEEVMPDASAGQAGGGGGSPGAGGTQGAGDSGVCAPPCDLPNAKARCNAGRCEIVECNPGYGDCDQELFEHHETGCETNLAKDPKNCGACGNHCPLPDAGTPLCSEGVCGQTNCPPANGRCGGSEECGTDLRSAGDCGFCGNVCNWAPDNGSPACIEGSCDFECDRPDASTPFEKCPRTCVDPGTGDARCASSCEDCTDSERCTGGTCRCPDGKTLCGGVCQDCSGDRICFQDQTCQCPQERPNLCAGQCRQCCTASHCASGVCCGNRCCSDGLQCCAGDVCALTCG
jgi:hypothetical protein